MDEITKSIYSSYKSGKYFEDAIEWYGLKYLYPTAQRLNFLFYIILLALVAYMLADTSLKILEKPEKYIYMVNLENSITTKSSIKELEHPVSSQLAIAEMLIRQFVIKYESYDYFQIPKQFEYIKNNSSREVALSFYHKMDLSNNNSPILKYQKHSKIVISDIKVEFYDSFKPDNGRAIVTLKKNIISTSSSSKVIEDVMLTLDYELTDIEKIVNKQKSLIFIVKEYIINNS
ncbi:VirB8 family type IV secretion system protein [Rickettsiales endosymbiont of Stachyamoeba lipophora]|uniref:type IV secretion system protein n=1 Tax=Rickettsiales endosymbiont of Stachyamoeba lipophora TaxID=2486578 RepID=UPI000F655423|nr:type IV secretion system protein [Rickettsiales endosymbiont of Stachyamoeba lipophora]AZL15617.1 type IV secretion system protein [Rickettsiales endosymbiont of Stachyamoeba lipophora]